MLKDIIEKLREWCGRSRRYYFFHIPKTAGSTLRVILASKLAKEEICPPYYIEGMLQLPRDQVRNYRLFWGHHYNMMFHVLPFQVQTFAFIRDPIERSLSHYQQIRRAPTHYFHEKVKQQGSFLAFLQDPETQPMVANFQARSLLWDANPYELAARFTSDQIQRRSMERWLETHMLEHLSPGEMLAGAKQRLDSFAYVGITEEFEGCLKRMFHRFGWGEMPVIARQNVSETRVRQHDLCREELRLLDELTAVDRELYDHARKLAA